MCLEESRRGPGPPLMVSGSKEGGGRGQTKRERQGSGAVGSREASAEFKRAERRRLDWREEDKVMLVSSLEGD